MIDQFIQHIQNNLSFLKKAKLLIAVSGGIDSIVLTHLLHKLEFTFSLAHVNYQLRNQESDQDMLFVKDFGTGLQTPVFIHTVDTESYAAKNKLSIQMAAREIRYQWFDSLLQKHKYDFILTAHHLDDDIETFFINLNRSSGLKGLTGIPQQNDKIIRPLLAFSRDEILEYAQLNKLTWREDASNATSKYLRNKIRHQLAPILEDINPDFKKAFSKSQKHLKESQALVDDYILSIKPKIWKVHNDLVYISLKKLLNLSNVKAIIYELLKNYGFTEWNDINDLITAQSGKQVFSKTHSLLKDREFLVLSQKENGEKKIEKRLVDKEFNIKNFKYKIETVDFQKIDLGVKDVEYIDKSKINFPLFVRKWQKGDYFYPLGIKGKKKLSDFFIDLKLSRLEKEKIWLLCDAQNKIIWVIDKRLDNRFKITKNTTKIIKITSQDEKNS